MGPNLKDVRLKLKNWIPVWLKKPTDFRPTTKMPNFGWMTRRCSDFRLHRSKAGLTVPCRNANPEAAHGKNSLRRAAVSLATP